MGRPLWVGRVLIGRSAARPTVLVICALALLAELPRLADYFRKPQHLEKARVILDESGGRGTEVKPAHSPAFNPEKAPAVQTRSPTPVLPSPGGAKPSQQVLAASPATKPEMKGAAARKSAAANLQAAQDLINGRIPATQVDTSEDGLLSDGYLPPWSALREKYHRLAQSEAQAAWDGALTIPVTARSARRQDRVSRRRAYAGARRKVRLSFSPFGGYFRY